MAFFKKVYEKLLGEEADEEKEDEEIGEETEGADYEEAVDDMTEEKNTRDFTAQGRSLELKIARLSAFDSSVMEVADHLIAGRPVVLNLEAAPKEVAKRIIDFFSGVAYTIRGQLKNISGGIYIATPSNVDVSNDSTVLAGGKAKGVSAESQVASGAASSDSGRGASGASPYEGF